MIALFISLKKIVHLIPIEYQKNKKKLNKEYKMSYRKPEYQKIDNEKSTALITPNVLIIAIAVVLLIPGDTRR